MEEIFQLVQREIQKCGLEDLLAAGVVITGGSTLLAGMPELAEEVLGLPVRRGLPRGIGGLADVVKSPMYATAVGLVDLRRASSRTEQPLFSIRDENVVPEGEGPDARVAGARSSKHAEDRARWNRDSPTSRTAAKIKVVGVGGGGGNAVNTMIAAGLERRGVHRRQHRLPGAAGQPGGHQDPARPELTKGLGAGANPEIGRQRRAGGAATRIGEALEGADMVFVTAGMGGGTGTGARAGHRRDRQALGALTVGVVTKPFVFEGNRRRKQAEARHRPS